MWDLFFIVSVLRQCTASSVGSEVIGVEAEARSDVVVVVAISPRETFARRCPNRRP